MSNGYLKFTGDYTKLKSMGYTFQKLYANNYMSWHKDETFIFKKGADISNGSVNLYKLVEFLRTNPKVKGYDTHISFYKFYTNTNRNEYEFYPMTDENREIYGDNLRAWLNVTDDTPEEEIPEQYDTIAVSKKLLTQLQELKDLGWYELIKHEV